MEEGKRRAGGDIRNEKASAVVAPREIQLLFCLPFLAVYLPTDSNMTAIIYSPNHSMLFELKVFSCLIKNRSINVILMNTIV